MADKRRLLSIDLETFSDVDLTKCGVYRYVEGDFHILLFAYAFDDEETKIVDLACGEKLPQEVVDAIFDDSIIKAAWNAQFERTCLSKYFNTRLSQRGMHSLSVPAYQSILIPDCPPIRGNVQWCGQRAFRFL